MQMTVAEVLRAARAKITEPGTWCKHMAACDRDGVKVHPREAEATSFCMLGSLQAVATSLYSEALTVLAEHLSGAVPWRTGKISAWNDNPVRTHAEVLAAFDRAIAAAEKTA